MKPFLRRILEPAVTPLCVLVMACSLAPAVAATPAGEPPGTAPAAAVPPSSTAPAATVAGLWGTKYGELFITQTGDQVEGVLTKSSNLCPFAAGEKILTGVILEDSITGTFLMCQADDDCGPPVNAQALLLIAKNATVLTGTAHSRKAVCPLVGYSKNQSGEKGLYFMRLNAANGAPLTTAAPAAGAQATTPAGSPSHPAEEIPVLPGPPAPPGTYDPRAATKETSKSKQLLQEGKQILNTGQFERARRTFEEVLTADPGNPTALTGIGATYYGRNQYPEALDYYKKALDADPNFGLAYYNMACVYALQNNPDMAMRYLKFAVLNGFIAQNTMDEDPDLAALRERSDYKELLAGEY